MERQSLGTPQVIVRRQGRANSPARMRPENNIISIHEQHPLKAEQVPSDESGLRESRLVSFHCGPDPIPSEGEGRRASKRQRRTGSPKSEAKSQEMHCRGRLEGHAGCTTEPCCPPNFARHASARAITTTESTPRRDWTQFPCLHGLGSESVPSPLPPNSPAC
jgi:hypothetical protein